MFEQNILINKLFSSSEIVGAFKDKTEGHFLLVFALLKWPLVHSEARSAF